MAHKQPTTALCLIDVINEMSFQGSQRLVRDSLPMASRIKALKMRAHKLGIPAIYINDNFGNWKSDFKDLVQHCVTAPVPGRRVAELLKPAPDDYFILKPKFSAFYDTSLSILLWNLKIKHLILTGVAANICVLFTASDAHMRDFRLIVPSDCVASNTPAETKSALRIMQSVFQADTTPSRQLLLRSR